jgi:transformation/transcription domain-associated protein
VATRHILTPDSRSSFVPYIDVLLEEKVLVGTGITCREVLRPLGYSVVADLIHHVRGELDLSQLSKVVQVFSSNLNDPSFTGAIHTMCAKLLNTIIESISTKDDKAETAKQMRGIYVTCIEKMTAFIEAYDRIKAFQIYDAKGKGKAKEVEVDGEGDVNMDESKGDEEESTSPDQQTYGWREIEQAMPIHAVAYADESLEVFCKEGRYLYKTLLHLFRTLLSRAKDDGSELRAPDGELLGMFFEHNLRALIIFEGVRDPREAKEAIELFSQILLALDPHEFAEIWTTRMDFFVELAAQNMHVFSVIQVLITHQDVSHQLVGILLKYLMDRLGDIGSQNKQRAHLTLRLFKMSFLAINSYIDKNEAVLVPHLQKLIMGSFTHAAKAADPTTYYHILRALFRSIGGGRFEALYKEVLPILQEMLDTLAYLLKHATEESQKDLFTELTLTVPVRLTNLLPHLQYLMAPLVHALKGGHELVSQGLRTLELCIDNLTADFLDPNLGPVLRDLMSGLNKLLKSVPANRAHSHNAIKILGKLGGRNRRFEEVEYQLDYRTSLNELSASLTIEGKPEKLQLEPLVDTALRVVKEGKVAYIEDAVKVLQSAVLSMLAEVSRAMLHSKSWY